MQSPLARQLSISRAFLYRDRSLCLFWDQDSILRGSMLSFHVMSARHRCVWMCSEILEGLTFICQTTIFRSMWFKGFKHLNHFCYCKLQAMSSTPEYIKLITVRYPNHLWKYPHTSNLFTICEPASDILRSGSGKSCTSFLVRSVMTKQGIFAGKF